MKSPQFFPENRVAMLRSSAIKAVFIGLVALGLAACTSSDPEAAVELSSTTRAPTTTTSTTTEAPSTDDAEVAAVTTVKRVPSSELVSGGHITVGSERYDFAFECWAAGAGDILALGVGDDPNSDEPTQAIVQAFFGSPYVSILIGDDRVIELSITEPAELFVQSDVIRGSALRFVDAEGSAGVGEQLGLGSVTVECDSFAPGLPEGYDVG